MKNPIVLTMGGDVLTHYPDSNVDDDRELNHCPGVHLICQSFIDLKSTSCTANALVCRGCRLRIEIPQMLRTFGELRGHFAFQPDASIWTPPAVGKQIVCVRSLWPYQLNDVATVVERPSYVRPYVTVVQFEPGRYHNGPVPLSAGMIGPYGAFV